eukprot:gene340-622_t
MSLETVGDYTLEKSILVIRSTDFSSFTEELLSSKKKKIAKYERLDFSECVYHMNDQLLREVIDLNPRITYLNLARCERITDSGTTYLSKLANLQYLSLYLCRQLYNVDYILRLSSLTHLDIRDVNHLKPYAPEKWNNLQNLRELQTTCFSGVTIQALKAISQLPHLARIVLDYVDDTGLSYFANLPNLTHLNIKTCYTGTAETFSKFGQGLQVLIVNNNLKDLYRHIKQIKTLQVIGGVTPISGVSQVNDDSDDSEFEEIMLQYEATYVFSLEEENALQAEGVIIDPKYVKFFSMLSTYEYSRWPQQLRELDSRYADERSLLSIDYPDLEARLFGHPNMLTFSDRRMRLG